MPRKFLRRLPPLAFEILEERSLLSVTVSTDQPNYAPNDVVTISATGFQPGEIVELQVLHTDGSSNSGIPHQPWQVSDGGEEDLDGTANGQVESTWALDADAVFSRFQVEAIGLDSGDSGTCEFTAYPPPELSGLEETALALVVGAKDTTLTSSLEVSHESTDMKLTWATVQITDNYQAGEDLLELTIPDPESATSFDVDVAWRQIMEPYLQSDLWSSRDAYDAGHYAMIPLQTAFELNRADWQNDFSRHFQRFVEIGSVAQLGTGNRVQYLYLASRFVALAAEHGKLSMIPGGLVDRLYSEANSLWTREPAWLWARTPFLGGIRERVVWQLDNFDVAKSYYRALFDESMFVMAIAADLRSYERNSSTSHLYSDTITDVLQVAERVFQQEGTFDADGRWLFQTGVWEDHSDYAFAGHTELAPDLSPLPRSGISQDTSHYHRLPVWLTSFVEAYSEGSNGRAFYESLKQGLEAQFHEVALSPPDDDHPFYRTNNFMDGWNGVYRYGYATQGQGNGYAPYQLSGTLLLGWWSLLDTPRIQEVYRTVARQFPLSEPAIETYVGPNTTRDRHPLVKLPDSLENGFFELITNLAAMRRPLVDVISPTWDAATGTLTLSGNATATNYQAALRSVTYRNTKVNATQHLRTVSFQVSDGTSDSNVLVRQVAVVPTTVTTAALDATTFGGNDLVSRTAASQSILGDDFVPIDVNRPYQLMGSARSGDGSGGLYTVSNKQYFGFASYDIDKKLIAPLYVLNVAGATDTRLAQDLLPGQTQVLLENAGGWYEGSTDHMRSLAWYGYQDSTGYTYSDYTYTRNVLSNAWSAGQINGNVITLRVPWSGPALSAGTAVRNARSGSTYNYAALSAKPVPAQWTDYAATISGRQQSGVDTPTQFRWGTAYIKPVILANYQGNSNNQVTWRNVAWRPIASRAYQIGESVDLRVTELPALGSPLSYRWTQVSGPTAELRNPLSRVATIIFPTGSGTPIFQVEVTNGSVMLRDAVAVNAPPRLAALEGTTLFYTENDAPTAVTEALAVNDADSTVLTGATIRISANYRNDQDILSFGYTDTISSSWNGATGTLTLSGSGTLADYETALRSVRYRNLSDNPATAVRQITFQVNDGFAVSNQLSRALKVSSTNDVPVIVLAASSVELSGDQVLGIDVSAVSFADSDAGTGNLRATVTLSNATLTLGSKDGLSFSTGDGVDDVFVSFTGTLAKLNHAFVGASVMPLPDFVGTATLAIKIDDLGNYGAGGKRTDEKSIVTVHTPG